MGPFVSDIENVMRYFNINQVEKGRYYEQIHTKKKRYDEKRYYEEEYVQERRKQARMRNGTHEFT